MKTPKGYVSVTHLQDLLSALIAHNDELDEAERPPEGDDYNDIYNMSVAKLSALINDAGSASPEEASCAETITINQVRTEPQTQPTYQVGAVLMAIVLRIRLADARALVAAYERCWQEQANGNAGSQNRVSNDFAKLTQEIAGRMVASDRQYVETLLAPPQFKQTA
ncbi:MULTISPECIES: hypothetical protein [unclassified Pseudomonas]|uniref:hypothetical protein n=1 Tax=unclassified Pseudomonas TaxID=196821 RepID=UPI000C86BFBF|nr:MULTISPECIES: hypothetical protein [unclassified Pseudomonas]PMV96481.1 hypothetical protein C1X55_19305 [Pseudomonas sp. GW460-C8]PMW23389.1 hypothetical protein C1X53_12605 [Pseudomonas sp. GW456-E6]PMW24135.1 hypothetical protein C1X40_04780 [Pseudomonas sp. GW456-11-11-14-TSB2]PMW40029.1 hypothetical protein C1X45_08090 [Pseudomonas sp. GW460-7]PMW41140.1 hypothetical protein C1X48_06725 [Pseudomonas sp. FW305-3-2-15-A-R2A1]